MGVSNKIIQFLNENKINFEQRQHAAASTCEDSARFRGEGLEIGGKTLLMKDKNGFHLFVLAANLSADSNRMRKILGQQKLRFATGTELMEQCGVVKGALPPFGRPIQPFDLYLDHSILRNDRIAFNNGVLTESIILATSDYINLTDPKVEDFSK